MADLQTTSISSRDPSPQCLKAKHGGERILSGFISTSSICLGCCGIFLSTTKMKGPLKAALLRLNWNVWRRKDSCIPPAYIHTMYTHAEIQPASTKDVPSHVNSHEPWETWWWGCTSACRLHKVFAYGRLPSCPIQSGAGQHYGRPKRKNSWWDFLLLSHCLHHDNSHEPLAVSVKHLCLIVVEQIVVEQSLIVVGRSWSGSVRDFLGPIVVMGVLLFPAVNGALKSGHLWLVQLLVELSCCMWTQTSREPLCGVLSSNHRPWRGTCGTF